jgi:single-stranded-DNA-specific exonuclease
MVSQLARSAGVDSLCARVLANRGVAPEAAADFLSPSLAAIGMPEEDAWGVAARRVARAVKNGERIGVFGDYDTDGITSPPCSTSRSPTTRTT